MGKNNEQTVKLMTPRGAALLALRDEAVDLVDAIDCIEGWGWVAGQSDTQRLDECITGGQPASGASPDAKTLNTLFWYDPEQNRVLPDSLAEVIEKSTVLPRMKVMMGVSDIKSDMERRVRILERIRDRGITDVPDIHRAINTFYHPPAT
ncbi:MAG: hypothetical protein OXK17_01935 [Thaumarchaeota archaeon]|nr:hypothetical protein [Nitrososphaerota archaeon]